MPIDPFLIMLLLNVLLFLFPWFALIVGILLTAWSCFSRTFRKRSFIVGSALILLSVCLRLYVLYLGPLRDWMFHEVLEEYYLRVYMTYGLFFILILYFTGMVFVLRAKSKKEESRYPIYTGAAVFLLVSFSILNSVGTDYIVQETIGGALNLRAISAFLTGDNIEQSVGDPNRPWCPVYRDGKHDKAFRMIEERKENLRNCDAINDLALFYEQKGRDDEAYDAFWISPLSRECLPALFNFLVRKKWFHKFAELDIPDHLVYSTTITIFLPHVLTFYGYLDKSGEINPKLNHLFDVMDLIGSYKMEEAQQKYHLIHPGTLMPEESKILQELKEMLANLEEPENLKQPDYIMGIESYNQICYEELR